jgi:hypothetical protein
MISQFDGDTDELIVTTARVTPANIQCGAATVAETT